jgi:Arm DNA-binding domain
LYLEVMPNGSKYWRMKYRFGGKEKRLAFGVYPAVPLKQARLLTDNAKRMLSDGIDPGQHKQELKQERQFNAGNTLNAISQDWLIKKCNDKSPRPVRFFGYILPWLGDRAIN